MKIQNKKGFTLIELMIVIAIIGILAVTIVPQLTGAQARARDTGRLSNVRNAYTSMVTYRQDFDSFPSANEVSGLKNCFSKNDGTFNITGKGNYIKDLLSGQKAPLDPQKGRKSDPCTTENSLGYNSISKSSIPAQSFYISTNVESLGQANYVSPGTTWPIGIAGFDRKIVDNVPAGTNELKSMFVQIYE